MGVLEQITQMKESGMEEPEIINQLQQQGISPKNINDALSNSQIKSAISDEENTQEYQPSEMNPEIAPPLPSNNTEYSPSAQEIPYDSPQINPMEGAESYSTGQKEYEEPLTQYPEQEGYQNYPQEQTNYSDTMIEVSEQVFSEKIKKIQKQLDSLTEFKTLSEIKIDNSEKRLKRIEQIMDKLQIAILEKIGSYGKNLEHIKKEMGMMQDSFGKMINPLLDKKITTHKTISKTKK